MPDVQDRLIILILAKTGCRIGEILAVDVEELDWKGQSVRVKDHPKRTHCWVFFDAEAVRLLRKWLSIRETWTRESTGALFLGNDGKRMTKRTASARVTMAAQRVGLHDPKGEKHEHFSPQVLRHWFTTTLREAGMEQAHVDILRGDRLPRNMATYHQPDLRKIRQEYLKLMPRLGSGAKPKSDAKREARTQNASFGHLTPQEASRDKHHQPRDTIIELRRKLAHDLQRGRLARPAKYVDWLVVERGMRLKNARPTVSHQLRLLGVPPLNRGPHTKAGWRLYQKELQAAFTGKKKKTR